MFHPTLSVPLARSPPAAALPRWRLDKGRRSWTDLPLLALALVLGLALRPPPGPPPDLLED